MTLRIALAQVAQVFLDRRRTVEKAVEWIEAAGQQRCELLAFGEALIPGYPVWLSRTDGARFNSPDQKELFARYAREAVVIEQGHLDPIAEAARKANLAVILGVIERPTDRGGHSLYCARVFIDASGTVLSVHRKLMPTYEERLVWGMGDGSGLVSHRVRDFTVGALLCWENWMPLARAALYAAGVNLHVMLWPGSQRLTRDVTRFVALESRSFVVSVGGLLRESDLPRDLPAGDRIAAAGELLYDGGSCVAAPDGRWIIEPSSGREELLTADLNIEEVYRERQNFDPAGHYARPDVLRLIVNRARQRPAE
jgi:nitrilase